MPRFGLGNKLILWAKANILAKKLSIPCYVLGWVHFSVGPVLRKERSKRIYFGYFRTDKISFIKYISLLFNKIQVVPWNSEHILISEKILTIEKKARIFDFSNFISSRKYLIQLFNKLVSDKIKRNVNNRIPPVIGIHVRRGDFVKTSIITPIEYYKNIILSIRSINGNSLPVTIFSDGTTEQLQLLLDMEQIKLSSENNDLVDLILLSKSQVIVTAIGSSYSYWAGFISESIVIHHPQCWVHKNPG